MFAKNETHVKLDKCLACGSDDISELLYLGEQPLANSYRSKKEDVPVTFPLGVNKCGNCYHVQLTHIVNPEIMFKNYAYMSGVSDTWKQYCDWFTSFVYETYELYNGKDARLVMDVGSNDGTQLDAFAKVFSYVEGVEPATNLAKKTQQKHTVWNRFFDAQFVLDNPSVYDIISAQNVFAHNYDPVTFLKCAAKLMHNESLLFIQTSQADMIQNGEFDTIYHEHINFFNTHSMERCANRAGLFLVDSIKVPIHGTSYIFVLTKNGLLARPSNIENVIEMEKKIGLYSDKLYENFVYRARAFKQEFCRIIERERAAGKPIIGYGAAAKGMTLLNYTEVDMNFIIDDTPTKQGLYTPGRNIQIVDSSIINKMEIFKKHLFVPLAWNYFDEIKAKIIKMRGHSDDTYLKLFPSLERQWPPSPSTYDEVINEKE